MICSKCGGEVVWMGPFSALTHTECKQCGAQNSQVVAPLMTKEDWIAAAAQKLEPYEGINSREYAESLYQTYVIDDGAHWEDDPEGAVTEDMTYWSA